MVTAAHPGSPGSPWQPYHTSSSASLSQYSCFKNIHPRLLEQCRDYILHPILYACSSNISINTMWSVKLLGLSICIHIHIYIYTHTHVCVYKCVYTYTHTHPPVGIIFNLDHCNLAEKHRVLHLGFQSCLVGCYSERILCLALQPSSLWAPRKWMEPYSYLTFKCKHSLLQQVHLCKFTTSHTCSVYMFKGLLQQYL